MKLNDVNYVYTKTLAVTYGTKRKVLTLSWGNFALKFPPSPMAVRW